MAAPPIGAVASHSLVAISSHCSGAVSATCIVVTAGLAEVAAGSIAMGLGGYLAARSDAEQYASERAREERETVELPDAEAAESASRSSPC